MTAREEFILEHPTRGTVVDQEYNPYGPNLYHDWSTRFSWTGRRSDAMRFDSEDEVRTALARIMPRIRDHCSIRRVGTWAKVELVEGGGLRGGV